eukprot:TRINITY_DN26923_c0_g1_i1.p1 TRINITY_DN26923_c0_g1~~TRINITY_DN26923_c0_g1_i1.p1  ORF type:complete len:611 (+),score=122.11 TRINITY_DN26923_c0_g1_i1:249-2081(+)
MRSTPLPPRDGGNANGACSSAGEEPTFVNALHNMAESSASTGVSSSKSHDTFPISKSGKSGEIGQELRPDQVMTVRKSMVAKDDRDGEKDKTTLGGANMFADADALRAGMHENIDKKDYDVMDFYYEEGCMQKIARSSVFSNMTLMTITVNALWIGFDAECNDSRVNDLPIAGCPVQPSDDQFWRTGENMFCLFFTWELLIRLGAFKRKWWALRDHWFKFDSILVTFMVVETWILPLVHGSGDALGDVSLLSMLKLLRLTRMVRLMRSVPELVTLMKGMAIAARSVGYTLLLLLIFMYIFSIVFIQQLEDTNVARLKVDFKDIFNTMWTLLLAGCLLDDITSVANPLLEDGFFMAAVFVCFVLVASLMVLNMLIGVLCAVVTAVAAAEKEKVLVTYVKSKLMNTLMQLDEDGNGTISKAEFDELTHFPEAISAFQDLGVDLPNLISLADHLFDADENEDRPHRLKTRCHESAGDVVDGDPRKSGRDSTADGPPEVALSFADFLEMVIRLRAENTPSVADIVELRKLISKCQRTINRRLNHLEKGQLEIQRGIRMVSEQLDSTLLLWEEMSISMNARTSLPPEGQEDDEFDESYSVHGGVPESADAWSHQR